MAVTARCELQADSDFDFPVDFLLLRFSLLGVSAMMRELTVLPSLKPLVREVVLAEARLIYAA